LEIFLLPIVVTVVGVFSAQLITHAQLESGERIARSNTESADSRAKFEQQIKILEISATKSRARISLSERLRFDCLERWIQNWVRSLLAQY
jgi:hypothetical protein